MTEPTQQTGRQQTGQQQTGQQQTGQQQTGQQETGRQETDRQGTGRRHTVEQNAGQPVSVPRGRGFVMNEILAMVTLGVVFGFLYYVLVQGWNALAVAMGPLGDLAQNVLIGGWFVVAPLALYVVRRPGAGLVAEVMASIVEVVFLGSPVGPLLLLSATIQGLGSELGFALFRYRRYDLVAFLVSGLTTAAFSFVYSTIRFGWLGQTLFATRLGLHLASGLVLCGVLGWLIARALQRTGVLRNLPAGRATAPATHG